MEIISSPRLILRATTEADIQPLHERIFSVPDVVRFVFAGTPFTLQQSEEFIKSKFNFAGSPMGLSTLVEKNSGEVIGFSGLNSCKPLGQDDLEIGFVLAKPAWKMGYATEIGKAQIEFGFYRLGRSRLLAMVAPDNAASIRAITKIGLQHEADITVEGRGLRRVYCVHKTAY